MFIISIILAFLLYRVVKNPATGPFTREVQLIWESLLGKIVIVIVLLFIAII